MTPTVRMAVRLATRLIIVLVAILPLLLPPDAAFAASSGASSNKQNKPRPKIGLALSGGGARGAAHIGILKVLEENRIPIDYIASTSMGSIVGGMYASGMSVAEIETFMKEVDWVEVFLDDTPRPDRSFRRKRDDDLYLIRSKLGISGAGLQFPAGALQGQNIDLLLKRYMLPVVTIRDFDDLSIPYRAIATDIATGQTVVLESGDLARAIRTSMSLPAVLAPQELDGRLLVDGGVSNNLPVDVVRDMGADVVIAIDISTPLMEREKLNSVLVIITQLTSIITQRNSQLQIESLGESDIFLQPDLGDIATLTRGRAGEAIDIGEKAAVAILGELVPLTLSEEEYREHLEARRKRDTTLPTIDEVRIVNQSRLGDDAIARMIHAKPGRVFDVDQMEQDLGEIYGLELFESAYYDITDEAGRTVLTVTVRERAWGPNYLQFGIAISGDFHGTNRFNVAAAYLRTAINRRGGEWRTGVQIGQSPGAYTEIYQPIDYGARWFVEPRLWGNSESVFAFDTKGNKLAEFRVTRWGGEFAAGRNLGTWAEVRGGIAHESGESTVRVGDPALPDRSFDTGDAFLQFYVDELDDLGFPTSGGRVRVRATAGREELGSDGDFEQGTVDAQYACTRGRNTALFGLIYETTRESNAPAQNRFRLGGFTQLSGLVQNELAGQRAALLSGAFYRRLGNSDFVPMYAGITMEYGNVFPDKARMKLDNGIFAGSIFAGLDTPIGPVYLAWGHAEGGRDNVYFFLGQLPRKDRLSGFRYR